MTDYELERYCDAHPLCDCNCMACPAFAEWHYTELGYYEEDDEQDEDMNESQVAQVSYGKR